MIRLLAHARRRPLILAFAFSLITALPLPLWADDGPLSRATLQGITAVRASILLTSNDAQKDGLTEDQLQTDVELRLRKAGITVIGSSAQTLRVVVVAYGVRDGSAIQSYAFLFSAALVQGIALTRDPSILALGETWSVAGVGTVGATRFSRYVRDTLADLIDQFINAYLEQNPKR